LEPEFPLEFVVFGTPKSLGASSRSREIWKNEIRNASRSVLPEGHWATTAPIAITLFYFPTEAKTADIDNIVKPILDALNRHIYIDDRQVERILVQIFESDSLLAFGKPSRRLREAIAVARPKLNIRISTDPFEELRQ
jgi:crossover junction endodeoxyribonuclease RusA